MFASSVPLQVPEQARALSALLNNHAHTLQAEGALETAIALMRRAVATNPADLQIRLNLAAYLMELGAVDEAFALTLRTLEAAPDNQFALNVAGFCSTALGDLDGAIAYYEKSAALPAALQATKFDLCCAYLRAGRFREGWELYKHRGMGRRFTPPPKPEWRPGLKGHVLVWAEEGMGDRIQFARFLPWVRDEAGACTYATDNAAAPLFSGYERAGVNVRIGLEQVEPFDYQVGIASLPGLYGAGFNPIPEDPGLLAYPGVSGRIDAGGLKIGLVWAGNSKHPNDRWRSMQLEQLLPLAADPSNDLFSLQCGPRSADIGKLRAQRLVTDLAHLVEGEWSQTAALLKAQIDLLVTVDTGIAHLAGALGIRTFVMVARHNDWRWLWDRSDSPWYPSVRVFRQAALGRWEPVVREVRAAIEQIQRDRYARVELRGGGA